MAVSRITVTGKEYYRVYRRWGDTTIQRYYPVSPNPKRALREATQDDESLAIRQQAYQRLRVRSMDYLIKPDGRIRGIQATRDYRYQNAKVYRVQIKLPWKNPQRRGWFSVRHYGDYEAFKRAVFWLCDYLDIPRSGELCERLLQAYPHYEKQKLTSTTLPEPSEKDELHGWTEQLAHEIKRFQKQAARVVKRK